MRIEDQFGRNLKRIREERDVSQDELAVRASLHRTEISQLERGQRMARMDTLLKISASLNVSPSDLLAGIVWERGTSRRGRFRETGD